MKNKLLFVILGVLVLAVIILVALPEPKAPSDKSSNTLPATSTSNQPASPDQLEKLPKTVPVQAIDKKELPKDFPADIPLEAGAAITLNFNTTNASGNFQASREFISKKTVAENYAFYLKSLKDSGWNITGTQQGTPAGDLIFATRGGNTLNIRIYTDSDQQVRVSINNEIKK